MQLSIVVRLLLGLSHPENKFSCSRTHIMSTNQKHIQGFENTEMLKMASVMIGFLGNVINSNFGINCAA